MKIITFFDKFLKKPHVANKKQLRKQLEKLEYRDAIVKALSKMVEVFTAHNERSFDDVISSGLQPIAAAAGLDRVAIYRLFDPKTGRMGQTYVWAYGKKSPLDDKLLELPGIPPVARWLDILMKGKYVHGNVKDMAEDQAAFCGLFNIKAILFVPIFTHGNFWGIITLEDHTNYRYFDENCLDLLCSSARLCANAFIRYEMTKNADKAIEALIRRENYADALNQMAIKFLSQSEVAFEEMMNAGIKLVANLTNVNRVSVWRNFRGPDCLHVSQIYRWDKESGGTTKPTQELTNVTYAKLAPRWEELLSVGMTINGLARQMPEAAMLKSFGVISVFITPVFINNLFWGFVLFEDRINERIFDEDTVEMMRSAAFLCVNTVIRADMERELSDANEFNRATLEIIPVGLTVIDDHLRFVDCNDAILNILGTTKQYFLEHFLEFSPEYQLDGIKSCEKVIDVHLRALNGVKFVFEWEHLSSSGEHIPFEITLMRTMYKGRYIVLAYQYDLRNIKRMEKEILEAEDLTHAVTEASSIPYVLFNEDLQPVDCNEAAIRVFESPDKHFLMEHYWDVFTPETQPNGQMSFEQAAFRRFNVLMEKQSTFEWTHKSFNGELIPMENTLTYITHRGKKLIISFKYDLRSTKKMMENIREQSELLKEALDKATIASRAKGEFLSNMSHEMRTPLNVIIGMTAIAKNASDLERKNYALNKIEGASTHLLGVINDVLDMSKIEANKLELTLIEFNFEQMLQKTIAVINFRVEEKHQKLTVNIDKNIPEFLTGDDQRLTQVITNLLGNAVKFTPDDGIISLDARILEEKNSQCTIQISVTDTGIGISDEHQQRLFQSFQQADASTVRNYGGTGLGLAICKKIVNMMGGDIWVESRMNKGSTFTFTFQAKQCDGKEKSFDERALNLDETRVLAVDNDAEIKKKAVKTYSPGTFAGHRILLVEDVEINREIVLTILEPMELEIDCAENGVRAIEMFREEPGRYEMIFMDVQMPEMDGYDATRHIRAIEEKLLKDNPANGKIPIIAMTANVFKEDVEKCLEAGMDDHIGKPLDFDNILEKLRQYLLNK